MARSPVAAASFLILFPSCTRAGGLGGERVEARHELLDLGPGAPKAPVEFVDQRGGPLEPGDQHVDVDLPLFEEADDRIELAAGLGVTQRVHRDRLVLGACAHRTPPSSSVPASSCVPGTSADAVRSTRLCTVPSANRVTISWSAASSRAPRTKAPSVVWVR